MTTPTIGDMIAKHREIKAMVEAAQEKFDAEWKPYKDALNAIAAACGAQLQEQGLQNFKSDTGTAYLQHGLSVKVDNRAEFLQFLLEDFDQRQGFLDAGVLKDPVRDWLDKYQADPPGIKTEAFIKCLIRK
jgi:hypothetical protein